MVFLKLSVKYWKKHKKRLLTLMAVTMIGAVALCMMALFIRSDKTIVLNRELDLLGDYDAVFYGLEENDIGLISQHEKVSASGYYRELGYAGIGGNSKYKVISFPDEKSVELYHMSCTKGSYPKSEHEIAIDIGTAKELGVVPIPGQKLQLSLFDLEKKELNTEEYTISGVFEASSVDAVGGFNRYPGIELGEYDVPAICVSDAEAGKFGSSLVTVFIQTEGEISSLANEISEMGFSRLQGYDIPNGRTWAYSYVLGMIYHINDEYGELTIDSLMQSIKEGNIWKDFYSAIVIPLFGLMIFIIIVVSVFSLVRNLLLDRSEQVAILRSIGMEKSQIFLYLFVELLLLISIFTGLGIAIGSGLHLLVIRGMKVLYDVNIPSGIRVSDYVASVTFSPWIYTILVLEISSVIASFLPLLRMVKATPIAVFERRFAGEKRRKKRHFSEFSKCGWRRLLGRHIHFQDGFVLVITCVVMGTCFLAYNYFRALSELNNTEYEFSLEESGLEEWDYTASKSKMAMPYEFLIENHHDYGIDREAYQNFAENPLIARSFARIVNQSTRLSYEKNKADQLPANLRIRRNSASSDSYENALYEAENAMIQQVGYSSEEEIYVLPSIGILESEFDPLSAYVKEGSIHLEKIRSGEEIVLLIPSKMEKSVSNQFHVGESIPLSDVVLSEEEENYSFGQMNPSDYKEPAYRKTIEEPESGAQVDLTSYAFGKRKDIETKIGAIVVLEDQELLKRYAVPYEDLLGGEVSESDDEEEDSKDYTLSLLCLPETFHNWQLPDELFTEVDFSLRENVDASKVNISWYQTPSACQGISFQSSYEIREKMQTDTRNTMLICYLMLLMLIFMGIVAIGIKFYSKVQLQSQTIAKLRALGMPLSWLERMIISQNILYPFIAAIVSLIPVCLCQMLFLYVRKKIDSGAWESIATNNVPWWHFMPFRYNLFGYHPVLVLALLMGAFLLLILLVTIPQILYIRKQSIVETIDTDSF